MVQEHGLLKDRVAIVTGGTAGIGKAITLEFARNGAFVLALGTNVDRGRELIQEVENNVGKDRVFFMQVDVSKKDQVDKAIAFCLERFQKLDILVNNAGITKDTLLLRMSEEDWDKVIDVNLKACFYTSQAAIKPFVKARSGKIINITSVVGLIGNPGQTNYAASKAGVIGFSKSLAKELASRNVTVNCIAPGYIETNMTQAIQDTKLESVINNIPLGRLGKPEEIAACALFLASNMATYITGQVITVDGGLSM